MSSYLIRYRDDVTVHPNPPLEFRCKAETYEDAVEKFYEEHPVSYNILDVMRESEPMGGFLTEQELLKWVGERCDEQMAGCPTCRAWTRFDLINHMRDEDEDMRIQFENEEAQIAAHENMHKFLEYLLHNRARYEESMLIFKAEDAAEDKR